MARRYFSSTAVATTLSAAANNVTTSITVTALSGFPNSTPWTAIIDEGTAAEEVVDVTNVGGTTLTVTRGVDGTAAVAHNAGATFKHGVSGRDFNDSSAHVNASTGVHSVTGAVVGTTDTQTLTNKTLTTPVIASVSNTGTVTLPTATTTLVGRDTTDTLTNKTINSASNTLTVAQSAVTDLTTDLGNKAPAANPTFTGVATFPAGTATAPSITTTGDTNTGVHFPAADTVAIATGGTERLRVNSSGNVAVGLDTPNAKVHVRQETSFLQMFGETLSTDANGTRIGLRKYRGSAASPTIVSSADVVGEMLFSAFDGAALQNAARIVAQVDGTPGAGDMPGRLTFWTTPDGSVSVTERMRIDSNGLITGTGTSLGAWTAYTPTLGGTGWAIGDGTTVAAYCQIGKIVHFRVTITFGSTSTFGAAAAPTVSLPVASVSAAGLGPSSRSMGVSYFDASLGQIYYGRFLDSGTSALACYVVGVDGLGAVATATAPFTWASGDLLQLSGTYQAA